MNTIFDIVKEDESTVAVFSKRDESSANLAFNYDRTGYTGNWAIRTNPNVDYVVIYHRTGNKNTIYKARVTAIEGPLVETLPQKRYRIKFSNCKILGTTNHSWPRFAHCGANPVRYINCE
jgi:hypothetical protein